MDLVNTYFNLLLDRKFISTKKLLKTTFYLMKVTSIVAAHYCDYYGVFLVASLLKLVEIWQKVYRENSQKFIKLMFRRD